MRAVLALSWRLLRSGGGRNRLGAVLVLVAVAASTAMLMFAIAANHAFGERAAREAWRSPVADSRGTAVEAMSTDYVRGRPVTVVDLAATDRAKAPVPPGMRAFPRPGEVWVSPALAALMRDLPADELADRLPADAKGELGDRALVHPDELVAVVGRSVDDPAVTADRVDTDATHDPTTISAFATIPGQTDAFGITAMYSTLAKVATVLMVVPLLVFGGAAARLTVARRDQRLAALRLVGATPRQVVAMTVAEATFTALFGAVIGVAVYAVLMPLLTRIEIRGGVWFLGDLWPGAGWTLVALAGVPLLVGASAVVGLRRVVVSPLGVANRQTPPGLKVIRGVLAVAALLAFPLAIKVGGANVGVGVAVMLLGLAFLGLNLAGPWVVGIIGRITAATATRPAKLLAGRRLVDDPRSAWRTVSGVALVGFVAGLLALFDPSSAPGLDTDTTRLSVSAPGPVAERAVERVRQRLEAGDVDASVTLDEAGPSGYRPLTVVPTKQGDVDRARTALTGTVDGHVFTTPADIQGPTTVLLRDIRTGAFVVLAVCFLIAMVSAAITAVSAVLDRRRAYALLRLAGTPLSVLDRARLYETTIPLAVMGGSSLAGGLVCGLPLAVSSPVTPYGLLLFGAFVVLGTAGVVGANLLSRPLLRAVTASPSPQPD